MWSTAVRLLALLAVGYAPLPTTSFRLVSKADDSADGAAWAASADQAALSDQTFWSAQWSALESDVRQLQQMFNAGGISNGLLQLSTEPAKGKKPSESKNAEESVPSHTMKVSEVKKLSVGDAKKAAPSHPVKMTKESTKSAARERPGERLAEAERLTKGLMGKAALAPMLDMLEGLYDDQKKRIGDLNKQEEQSKKRFLEQQTKFNQRIKECKDKHDRHMLSDEFFKNETRDYTKQFKYWQGVRERNHRQFHNALKITHGMMQREKDMIAKYKAAIALKVPAEGKSAAPAKAEKVETPEVVFTQLRVGLAKFCKEALMEIHHELGKAAGHRKQADKLES